MLNRAELFAIPHHVPYNVLLSKAGCVTQLISPLMEDYDSALGMETDNAPGGAEEPAAEEGAQGETGRASSQCNYIKSPFP